MIKKKTEKIVVSGIMLALAIVIPQVFHLIPVGNTGGVFVPMHIPVLLCGAICGPVYVLIVGMLSPIISSVLTGMPAVVRLPFMVVELMAYGLAMGFFYGLKKKMPIYVRILTSLIDAMVVGRVAYFISLVLAIYLFGNKNLSVLAVVDAFVLGLPGIIIQIILVPAVIMAVNGSLVHKGKKTLGNDNTFVCKNGEKIYKSQKRGVAPVMDLLESDPDMLKGAYVADKVIGKAAALLLVKGGIAELYTEIISDHAINVFSKYTNIRVSYSKKVPYIVNRTKDGMCPMEKATIDIDSPEEAYEAVKATLETLRNNASGERN